MARVSLKLFGWQLNVQVFSLKGADMPLPAKCTCWHQGFNADTTFAKHFPECPKSR